MADPTRPDPTRPDQTRPDPTRATKNWPDPGQKILTRTHHCFEINKIAFKYYNHNWISEILYVENLHVYII